MSILIRSLMRPQCGNIHEIHTRFSKINMKFNIAYHVANCVNVRICITVSNTSKFGIAGLLYGSLSCNFVSNLPVFEVNSFNSMYCRSSI